MNLNFWKGKRVLVAPAHGELASWILLLLEKLQADVILVGQSLNEFSFFDLINGGSRGRLTLGDFKDSLFWKINANVPLDFIFFIPDLESGFGNNLGVYLSEQTQIQTNILELFRLSSATGLVWLSSDRVYQKSGDILVESSPINPEGPTAAARLSGEVLLRAYQNEFFKSEKYNKHNKAASILRTSSGMGPSLKPNSLLGECASKLTSVESIEVRKPQSVRPWIHFLDQAHAVLLAAENLVSRGPKASSVFNIGSDEYETVKEVICEFAAFWERGTVQLVEDKGVKGALSLHRRLSSELAQKELSWKIKIDLSEALRSTANWYQAYLRGEDSNQHVDNILDLFLSRR